MFGLFQAVFYLFPQMVTFMYARIWKKENFVSRLCDYIEDNNFHYDHYNSLRKNASSFNSEKWQEIGTVCDNL